MTPLLFVLSDIVEPGWLYARMTAEAAVTGVRLGTARCSGLRGRRRPADLRDTRQADVR
jgi:hypothetical protein